MSCAVLMLAMRDIHAIVTVPIHRDTKPHHTIVMGVQYINKATADLYVVFPADASTSFTVVAEPRA